MLNKVKGQNGITLVALVVTIVVLLILAGITIALVFSQDGVIYSAQEAADSSNEGVVADNIQDAVVAAQISAVSNTADAIPVAISGEIGGTGISISGTLSVAADGTVTCTSVTATYLEETYDITYTNGVVDAQLQD